MTKTSKQSIEDITKNLKVLLTPEQKLAAAELMLMGFGNWNGKGLLLIPLALYDKIPDGTEVIAIDGDKLVKGKDHIDLDTRAGLLAFGILPHQYQEIFDIIDE